MDENPTNDAGDDESEEGVAHDPELDSDEVEEHVDGDEEDGVAPAAEETAATEDAPHLSEQARRALRVAGGNASVFGALMVHFPARDVCLQIDGFSALRIMTCFATRSRTWADVISPVLSNAENGWIVLDPDEVMAMSWTPDTGVPAQRLAVDPPLATS